VQAAELLSRLPEAPRDAVAGDAVELEDAAWTFPEAFVERPELVRRLHEARAGTIALIIAPPGYGKTALLAEWDEHDERPFLSLRIGSDVEPSGVAGELADALAPLAAHAGGVVVVLDDAHRVAPAVLPVLVGAVCRALPEDSVLALASRAAPALPLGRLRAHRALVEIGLTDLAMGPAEAVALLEGAGFAFELADVPQLVEHTEGWPAALYLAGLSLSDRPQAPEPAGFRGDDHLLSEYVHDEVLADLTAAQIRFLTRTAVLGRLSGPLCDSVLLEHGAGLTLMSLSRATALLEPSDAAHEWYRAHPVFRATLLAELRRGEPHLERRLHRRASAWYAEHGAAEEAIEHAAAAPDVERLAALLWEHVLPYLAHGRAEQVRGWLARVGHDRVASSPPLALTAALSELAAGDVAAAQRWERDAAAHEDAIEETTLPAARAVIDAAAGRGGAAEMLRVADRARHAIPENSPWQPVCGCLHGIAAHLGGDLDAASWLLGEAARLAADELPAVGALALAQRAMIAMEGEDWELAGDLADQVSGLIAAHGLAREPLMALGFAVAAASRAHEGRADEAKRDLRAGIDLLASFGDSIVWYGAEVRILLAHASLWLADVVGARTLLAQASRLARRIPDAVVFNTWFEAAWSYMDTLAETRLAGPSSLTIAELRILRFLPSHRSFREIADQLGVSANTVKTQAHAVYRKLGAASRSEAVARAIDSGLLGQ
jgi:LuxR family maltose regulon positive regulatory protein